MSGAEIAIVGAGLAGLACARALVEAGESVRVFDKGRAPGGRASTRRAGELRFDHGAQYFTARDARFRREVAGWRRGGLVAPWRGRIVALQDGRVTPTRGRQRRYVGVPGMSAIARALAPVLDVRSGVRVDALERDGDRWRLWGTGGAGGRGSTRSKLDPALPVDLGAYERVVLTLPADQARALAPRGSSLPARAAGVRMLPCKAVMLALDEPYGVAFDGAFVEGSALSWVARDGSKPGREVADTWVLHAGPSWSAAHADASAGDVIAALCAELERVTGRRLPPRAHAQAHTWGYALADEPLEDALLVDELPGLAWAGDWCHGSRIEGAWLSGRAAAEWALRGSVGA